MLRFSSVKMLQFAIQTRNAGICWPSRHLRNSTVLLEFSPAATLKNLAPTADNPLRATGTACRQLTTRPIDRLARGEPVRAVPRCGASVGAGLSSCPSCGIDVALAAVLLERQALSVIPAEPGAPFVGDAMLSRFGEFLMKRGYIGAASSTPRSAGSGNSRRPASVRRWASPARTAGADPRAARAGQRRAGAGAAERPPYRQRELEQRVAERTRELEQAYRKLRSSTS